MSFTSDLLGAVAQYLADGGMGTWRPTAPYQPSDPTPIFLRSTPASPDRAITLGTYVVDDDYSQPESVIGLQVRLRGDRNANTVAEMADQVFDLLHGMQGIDFDSGRIVMSWRNSGTPLGQDANERHEQSENYYLTVWRPSPHRA